MFRKNISQTEIKSALDDFRKGKFLIVVDDKCRENEGDLVIAANKATPKNINFMIKRGRGLVCVPMLGKRLDELKIPLMIDEKAGKNTEFTKCAFTISVDAKKGTTSGISAFDRAKTIEALIGNDTKPQDLAMPGHIFPLRCDEHGLKGRQGHTEASMELARLAGVYPAAVICEVIDGSGKMARMPELKRLAKRFGIKIVTIRDLIDYSAFSG